MSHVYNDKFYYFSTKKQNVNCLKFDMRYDMTKFSRRCAGDMIKIPQEHKLVIGCERDGEWPLSAPITHNYYTLMHTHVLSY